MEHCRFRGDILEVQRPKSKCQTKFKCLNDLGVGLGTEDWRLEAVGMMLRNRRPSQSPASIERFRTSPVT
jgi:hypothetical protein